jgi:hypothetical protein
MIRFASGERVLGVLPLPEVEPLFSCSVRNPFTTPQWEQKTEVKQYYSGLFDDTQHLRGMAEESHVNVYSGQNSPSSYFGPLRSNTKRDG